MASVNLTTHVSGLASGMDTESIVNNLMKVNRIPLDKLQQAKTINTWKQDAYRDINTKIASFRDAMQDLRLQGTFLAQKATASDSRVDAVMSGSATQTNFSISEVQLAIPAKAASVSFDSKIAKSSDKIGNASDFTFTMNSTDITIPAGSTFDQAISIINSKSDATNVKASIVGGSIVYNTIRPEAGTSISLTGTAGDASTYLKLTDGDTSTGSGFAAGTFTDGTIAKSGYAVINGVKINISSNTFTYDGVQFNLKQSIDPSKDSPASVSITSDTDKIFDKVKNFVDKYNELIKDLNDKLSETKNRDYPPLTDDQRKNMKDDEIKLWEDKAKSGLLANDPTIRQFLTKLRSSLNEAVQNPGINSSFKTLSDIGITPSTNYRDNGKLVLDDAKLKDAITANLSAVQNLFSIKDTVSPSTDTTINNNIKYNNSGLAIRLYDRINDTLSSLKVIAGSPGTISINSNLAKEASSLDDRIKNLTDRLNTQEQSLWTKFNAMESALQKLNTQSSWLTQQLGQ